MRTAPGQAPPAATPDSNNRVDPSPYYPVFGRRMVMIGYARRPGTQRKPPAGQRIEFPPLKQPSGKVITAFAVRSDLDLADARSNTFELEWPRGSGRIQAFPEIDRVDWFPVAQARTKLLTGHRPFLDRLMADPALAGLREG